MTAVDPAKRTPSQSVMDDITEGISTIRSAADDGNWMKWDEVCRYMALVPLLVFYRYLVPVLKFVAQKY